ncbi:MAG: hypothetical protein V2A79_06645 [Planctomycetota bacterium]
MKKTASIAVLGLFAALAAFGDTPGFDRYQVILDRKPFGTAPPAEAAAVTVPAQDSFAKNLRMSALLELDDGTMKIGLIDQASNKSFFLAVGDTEEGVELVSADYDKEEAVVRKGSEMAVIKLQSGEIQALTPAEQQARLNAPPTRRPSYAERRLARQQQRQQPAPPPEPPKYTGEELERHLQEYQMEVIRQGLPPLPIPLTPEMDQQLVQEGVLPPMQ